MSHSQAGRLGGKATYSKYGIEHYRTIGRKGDLAFWTKYTLRPVDIAAFAIIERSTGKCVALTNYKGR
jgi:hypothetical protein